MSIARVLFGRERVENFQFVVGETPFTQVQHVGGICVGYFMLVYGLQAVYTAPKQRSKWLQRLTVLHSSLVVSLSVGSLVLLVDMCLALARRFRQQDSMLERLCGLHGGSAIPGELQFLYYLNYWFKWYELLDTVLLVLKNKPLIFLHVYHHPATLFLTWIEMYYQADIQYVPITLNLAVHVIMYFYYALTALGYRPRWKRVLTVAQITQFVLDVAACTFAVVLSLNHTYYGEDAAFAWPCKAGETPAGLIGNAILYSYLVLFLAFYRKTYRKPPHAKVSVERKLK